MSLRFRNSLLALALVGALVGCDREQRQTRGKPLAQTLPAEVSPDTVFPGGANIPPPDPRAAAYEKNAPAIAEGQRLYNQMNCVGCHFHGGGGIGVALMDAKWRYGGRIDQIAASIMEGRPNGMPAWRGRLTEQQVWQLAAYVRTLKTTAEPRPRLQTKREPPTPADSAEQ